MSSQILSLLGALLVLIAYISQQIGRMPRDSKPYLLLNFLGAGFLLAAALITRQIGFIFLQGAWLLISGRGLFKKKSLPGRQAG